MFSNVLVFGSAVSLALTVFEKFFPKVIPNLPLGGSDFAQTTGIIALAFVIATIYSIFVS